MFALIFLVLGVLAIAVICGAFVSPSRRPDTPTHMDEWL